MNEPSSGKEQPFARLLPLFQKLELYIAIACFAALLFKSFHLPGANLLLIVTLGTLTMIYFLEGMSVSGIDAGSKNIDKMILKLNGIGSSIGTISILFMFLHWPGGRIMVLISSGALLFTLLFMIRAKSKENAPAAYSSRQLFRTVAIVFLQILLYFFAHSPSSTV